MAKSSERVVLVHSAGLSYERRTRCKNTQMKGSRIWQLEKEKIRMRTI